MGSEETIVLHPEDFEDFHKLAAKLFSRDPTKPGRPTKEEQEFRVFLKEFSQFKALKETGVYDKFFDTLHKESTSGRPIDSDTKRRSRDRSEKSGNIFSGILKGDFNIAKFFSEEVAEETIAQGIKTYGPIAAIVAAMWIAESQVKDFPPVLHTSYSLLVTILKLVNAAVRLFEVIGGFLTDPLDIDQAIEDIKNVFTSPGDLPEEELVRRRAAIKTAQENFDQRRQDRRERKGGKF